MTVMTAWVKVIYALLKGSSLIITSYTSSADMLASLLPQSQEKWQIPLSSLLCLLHRKDDEWRSPYRHKPSCLPHSSLMSTASSIDLLVDLKEIQSQSPPVAFFLLWEIKWLHSPCLSPSPSSFLLPLLLFAADFHWLCLPCMFTEMLNTFSGTFTNFPLLFPSRCEQSGGQQPCR